MKQKIFSKRCKLTKNSLTVGIARDRSKTLKKRERNIKNVKKSNNRFFTFSFLYRKIYVLLENIYLENLVCIVRFASPFFSRSRLLGMQQHQRPYRYSLVS